MENRKSKLRKELRKVDIKTLSLSDDAVMNEVLPNNPKIAKTILAPILGRSDFEVRSVETQKKYKFFTRHAVVLDCVIEFEDGTLCDLELQKTKSGMPIERLLYYAAMLRVKALGEGISYQKARTNIIVVIYNGDYFGEGEPLYEVFYRVQSGKAVDPKQMIYIANMKSQNKATPLGRLMADLTSSEPEKIADSTLRKALDMIQSSKGGKAVNERLLELQDRAIELGREEGHAEGRAEGLADGQRQTLLRLVQKGRLSVVEAAEELGVSEEEFQRLLDESE